MERLLYLGRERLAVHYACCAHHPFHKQLVSSSWTDDLTKSTSNAQNLDLKDLQGRIAVGDTPWQSREYKTNGNNKTTYQRFGLFVGSF